jgi:quercetin dioxygenase-like cupin family protein
VTAGPFVSRVEEGELLHRENSLFILRCTQESTAGAFTLVESSRLPVGDGPGLHVHSREDESFIVLSGRYRFIVDAAAHEAGPGAVVFAPRLHPHRFEALDEDSRLLHLFMPGGIDGYFRDQWSAREEGRFAELAASYGIQFLE